jgi:hypothetical protein
VGLITGLLTLPLAPVRGTVWLAEQIMEQAQQEMNDESSLRAALIELDEMRATGEYEPAEIDEAENELIERLMALRGYGREAMPDGGLE